MNQGGIMMREELVVGGRYYHFKDKYYEVLTLARDCEDPERELVVYKALYESPDYGANQVWVREFSDFTGYKEGVGGERLKRFTLLDS